MNGNIIACDPGKVTGFAWRSAAGTVGAHEADDWYDALTWAEHHLDGCDLLVCEAFIISPQTVRKSQQTISLELIGALRFLCKKSGTEFVLQTPADAKRLMTDARLRKLGWWLTGKDHRRDALRHLGLALVTRGLLDPASLIIPEA